MNTQEAMERASKEKLMEDLKMVVADAEDLLRATANQTGERIAAARAKAEDSLRAAKVRLAEAQAAVVKQVKVAAKTRPRLFASSLAELSKDREQLTTRP